MHDDHAVTAGWNPGEIAYATYLALIALAWVLIPMVLVLIGD